MGKKKKTRTLVLEIICEKALRNPSEINSRVALSMCPPLFSFILCVLYFFNFNTVLLLEAEGSILIDTWRVAALPGISFFLFFSRSRN